MTQASGPPGTTRPLPDGLTAGGRGDVWVPVRPRYVALDVDGTLVTSDEVPDADVLDAIVRLGRTGVQVGLATGRMAAAADAILATGVLSGPHVFHNGAVVTDRTGAEQQVLGLTDPEVTALLDFGRGRDDLTIEVYVGRSYLADRTDPRSDAHAHLLRAAPEGHIGSVADLAGRPAVKAVAVCFSPEAAVATIAAVTRLGMAAGPAASPATPQLRYVNVTRAGVDKGSGVEAAARLIGADLAAVAAIGDETNDIPMLARIGTAIAMGDADAPVRDHAHLVAPTFDAGGTVVALEALIALARD
jgi:Cof subfamily protein (haloacid dehalogenase superfamily)